MKITTLNITVHDLTEKYKDDPVDGVYGYNGKLCLRPRFQREFVYDNAKRDAVIETVYNGFPLGLMYWSKSNNDICEFDCLDGQQRSISIAAFVTDKFSIMQDGNRRYFHNLSDEEKEKFLNYELEIKVCDGSESEKLAWFKTINTAGDKLKPQELLNAVYSGSWLEEAKKWFSKPGCPASDKKDFGGYITGSAIRQDLLEQAIKWASIRDEMKGPSEYMAVHQHDKNADDLWQYFQTVIAWAKMLFPAKDIPENIRKGQDWGALYAKYHNNTYSSTVLVNEVHNLILDDEVTKKAGIIPYVLSDKTPADERNLSLRAFPESMRIKAFEQQNHKCSICGKEFEKVGDMQADHIVPWSAGGKTTEDNLQMLCTKCNNAKSDK